MKHIHFEQNLDFSMAKFDPLNKIHNLFSKIVLLPKVAFYSWYTRKKQNSEVQHEKKAAYSTFTDY